MITPTHKRREIRFIVVMEPVEVALTTKLPRHVTIDVDGIVVHSALDPAQGDEAIDLLRSILHLLRKNALP